MNKPSRRTAIAAAIGGVALTATAVGAVAMTGGTPEPSPESSVTEQPAPSNSDRTPGGDGSTPGESASPDGAISQDEAVEIAERALAEHGDVPPLDDVERDWEHGRAVWDIEFGDDHEVYVDMETGDVVRVDIDDERTHHGDGVTDGSTPGESASPDGAISRDQAVEIAERALAEHGDVPPLDEVERDWEHGRAVWDIEFGDDHEVYVDMETGDVVRVDIDDDHDDWDDDRYDD